MENKKIPEQSATGKVAEESANAKKKAETLDAIFEAHNIELVGIIELKEKGRKAYFKTAADKAKAVRLLKSRGFKVMDSIHNTIIIFNKQEERK